MNNLAENNVVRFLNITKKKGGIFANFKVKGIRGGTTFSASLCVDLLAMELDPAVDSVEKIVEVCAVEAVKQFRKTELQFEGLKGL